MTKEFAEKLYEMFNEEDESLKVIEDGDWISEHKYEYRDSIVEFEGKTYLIKEGRSGSYHTDYMYGPATITEVIRKEVPKIVIEWSEVKGEEVELESSDY